MKQQFDAIEFNRRYAFQCHGYGDFENLINKQKRFKTIDGQYLYFILLFYVQRSHLGCHNHVKIREIIKYIFCNKFKKYYILSLVQ